MLAPYIFNNTSRLIVQRRTSIKSQVLFELNGPEGFHNGKPDTTAGPKHGSHGIPTSCSSEAHLLVDPANA